MSDRLALAHLFALVTGTGEILGDTRRSGTSKALKSAGLKPLKLSANEKQVLLSGTELSTAFALAGLFEAERVFQRDGLDAFQQHERSQAGTPLAPGPFKPLLEALHRLRSGAGRSACCWRRSSGSS